MNLSRASSGLIGYVCVGEVHRAIGRSVPDGLGFVTIHSGAWAYCAAARPTEPHHWQEIEPAGIHAMRHARSWKARAEPNLR